MDGHHRGHGPALQARQAGPRLRRDRAGASGSKQARETHSSQMHRATTRRTSRRRPPSSAPCITRSAAKGLWHTPSKKVPQLQQLPAYVQNTARALMRDQGMDESQAIATAVNAVKEWATGRAFGGKVPVTPEVQQAAQRAMDEWAQLRASHDG